MTKLFQFLLAFCLGAAGLVLTGCSSNKSSTQNSTAKKLITGADRMEKYVPHLKGKRVAMLANQSSTIGGKPSVDVLLSKGVNIVKIFGPEHGFRGNASNGAVVGDEIDEKTGIPIISLYGKKRKPTQEDLADVDVMLFDVQDVGVRFYTKIITLRDVMESCAKYDVKMIVLDRPNPHGYMVDGPILDMALKSGIGQFPIPIAHGMTIGEFAQMINGEGWLTNRLKCKLSVVPLANYTHDTPYVLPVKPSPNLNTQQAVMLYPSLCLFEGTVLNHGRGTYTPFTILGAPALQGIYEFNYTPVGIPGMSEKPAHRDKACYGIDLRTYDVEELRRKRQINLQWVVDLYQAYPEKEKFFGRGGGFDRLAGNKDLRQQIIAGVSESDIRKTWEPGLTAYKKVRKKYLLYP